MTIFASCSVTHVLEYSLLTLLIQNQ